MIVVNFNELSHNLCNGTDSRIELCTKHYVITFSLLLTVPVNELYRRPTHYKRNRGELMKDVKLFPCFHANGCWRGEPTVV
jgi:hypothetical protein